MVKPSIMAKAGWIANARRHRLAIGLIAAYALLLSALLPAFATVADPLQAYLGTHLCGPGGGADNGQAPADRADHQQKCQLCGPGCSMGGHAPVATLSHGLIAAAPFGQAADGAHHAETAAQAPLSVYLSDIFSQGPPQAA